MELSNYLTLRIEDSEKAVISICKRTRSGYAVTYNAESFVSISEKGVCCFLLGDV